ncbi:IclR family transcriptional regulator [Halomarina halobia]|uniref:IclR family transcriptional regulator n=1 Tax=Halomarina halobia TaxID=3033386 RepID=A0ABD6AFN6_9EURY|nr:IclR family transcriptional regulator [Halomarina sp. PSR21]
MTENKWPIRSVQTSLQITKGLRELQDATITELAEHLGIPKTTVFNHLKTLEEEEFVVRTGDSYRLGLRYLELGESARSRHVLFQKAKPEVLKLAQETGELSGISTEEYGQGVFLFITAGENAVRTDTRTGMRVYLHTFALGKAILAYTPEQRVKWILDRFGLPAMTPNTITDRETLFEEFETIRAEGIAFDDEERVKGLRTVAAPIITHNERVLGAISVAAPTSRMKNERFRKEIPELVKNAANVVELEIRYS